MVVSAAGLWLTASNAVADGGMPIMEYNKVHLLIYSTYVQFCCSHPRFIHLMLLCTSTSLNSKGKCCNLFPFIAN